MFRTHLSHALVTTVAVPTLLSAAAMAQPTVGVDRPILRAFEEAEALFENLQQTLALELFTQVIDALMPEAEAGTLSPPETEVLLESLSYRARAGFNVGQSEVVEDDLDTAIRLNPSFACGARLVSPALIEACERLRSDLVGRFELRVSPPDADVEIDGRPFSPGGGPIDIVAGTHLVTVNRPGYAGDRISVEVEPGTETPAVHEVNLTRVSAVLRILTRPPGATVHVNTIEYGPTDGTAQSGPFRPRQLEGHPIGEFSDELTVPGIRPGLVSVVVTLEGYRTVRRELDLADPEDYPTHFVLERAEGVVLFEDLPEGATVEVGRQGEGEMTEMVVDAGRLTLSIGVYDLAVAHPEAGYFAGTATVVDRQEYLVPVVLRPSATVLGVLGDDTVGRDALLRAFGDAFGTLDTWTYQNRTETGVSLVEEAGLTAERLRRVVNPRVVQDDRIDWEAVRELSARDGRSSIYLLGVLDNDLAASYADLWMWRAGPGPPLPARLRISLTSGDARAVASSVRRAFVDTQVARPGLGALVIDTESEAGPFVVDVSQDGPAAQAGLEPGDVILSVDGAAVDRAVRIVEYLANATGETVTLGITRAGVPQELQLTPSDSPQVVARGDADQAYPAVAANLAASRVGRQVEQPDWVWDLNDAATRLRAGDLEGALEGLRRTERFIPVAAGVGRGTLDYWLGMAYTTAGPQFREQARQSFDRAAQDTGARLIHNDGPWVAPRARARLAWLDGGVSAAPR